MKAQRGSRGTAQLLLQPWHYMGSEVNATLRPLYPREKRPGTNYTGGWVGHRASLDGYGKSRLHQDSIPGPSSR